MKDSIFQISLEKTLNSEKKFWLFSIILINLFVLPVVIFGIKDQEAYQLHYFSLNFHFSKISNYFINYIDFYGPGTFLPSLEEDKLNPINFLFNSQTYFYVKYFVFIFIQVFYLKKIFSIFEVKNYLLILYSIFSLGNFNYIYSDDWQTIFSFSFLFPVFYYLIKFLKFEYKIDFLILVFFSSFHLINGHFGVISHQYILLFIYFLFQQKYFFLKKNYFYLGLLLFLIIVFNKFYFLITQYLEFPKNIQSVTDSGFNLIEFFRGSEKFNRSPSYGIINLIAIFYSIYLIVINQSKKIFYLNIFYIIIFINSFLPFFEKLFFISALWQSRDIYNIVSLILVAIMLKEMKNYYLKFAIHLITICFIINIFYINLITFIDYSKNNFIAKKIEDRKLIQSLEEINLQIEDNSIYKTYLSPEVLSVIRKGFSVYGIYAITDLINYKLYPFNGWFKYSSKDNIWPSRAHNHGIIGSNYQTLNNEYFLNFFLIDKILYFKEENEKIFIDKEIIKEIKLDLINKTLVIAKRKHYPLEFLGWKNKLDCEEKIKLNCIMNENTFKISKKIKLNKINLNEIEIENQNNYPINFLFPFTKPNNWRVIGESGNINFKINKFLEFGNLNLKSNTMYNFKYLDNIGLLSSILSILCQVMLLIYIILFYKKT
jgi:hypothetical protein